MKINEEVWVVVSGIKYKLGVFKVDEDWMPFNPFKIKYNLDTKEEDDDEEDEEVVSDTWEKIDRDLNEGEIGQAEMDQPVIALVVEDEMGNIVNSPASGASLIDLNNEAAEVTSRVDGCLLLMEVEKRQIYLSLTIYLSRRHTSTSSFPRSTPPSPISFCFALSIEDLNGVVPPVDHTSDRISNWRRRSFVDRIYVSGVSPQHPSSMALNLTVMHHLLPDIPISEDILQSLKTSNPVTYELLRYVQRYCLFVFKFLNLEIFLHRKLPKQRFSCFVLISRILLEF
ncbi:unnamed protein product [Lactuca virosa]|uniref:Uncharacterized protein n=1 Tax=Lactuca virosa TaxID=75947 RepID=A0AAU9N1A4_9ASTR|nr:unnamed protein product [Lactuca virosa]